MRNASLQRESSLWPHRWAVALACATFPLVWVGGLVTTTKAGMAVPDWPSTYGYNLFLYPWTTWLAGPWDLFVEHGHRLLGATVGMLTIALLVSLWRSDDRHWMRWAGLAALALVIFQGVLGGMRVRLDERTLAMLHGCTGPLFFALVAAIVVFTSRGWRDETESISNDYSGGLHRLTVITCLLAYLQILLGAVLRHVPIVTEPLTFALVVKAHLIVAAVLTIHVGLEVVAVFRRFSQIRLLRRAAVVLACLLVAQITLGTATWLAKYSVPYWAARWFSLNGRAIQDGGWLQTHIVTAHVAVGSLILITSLVLALYSFRFLSAPPVAQRLQRRGLGMAL